MSTVVKTYFGSEVALADQSLYEAKHAASCARYLIEAEILGLRDQLRDAGKRLRAAALVEKKAERAFEASPSGAAMAAARDAHMKEWAASITARIGVPITLGLEGARATAPVA
jgi:hypothetical protein